MAPTPASSAPPATERCGGTLLEQKLDKPAADWTLSDLARVVRKEGIRIVSLMHVGGDGWLKTLDFVPRSEAHLLDVLTAGERADGSSLFAETGISPGASDIIIRPRLDRAFIDPFSPCSTLVFVSEHLGRDGQPLPESPDTIVHRADARLRSDTGVELSAHGEVEYFLGKAGGAVYGRAERGYHATSPFVFGEALRRRAMAVLGDIGVPVKYGHAEVGYIEAAHADDTTWEQHEIELALAPLPDAADHAVLTQWVLRKLAHEAGMRVSFKPMLREGHAGSGMHFHFTPRRDDQDLAVVRGSTIVHPEARWLIAGLVGMGGALMAFGNRRPESFVRLRQGKEAPRHIAWGAYNRRALVRLPIQATTAEGRAVTAPTIEFRLPDGSVHPHLLLAAVAQVMAAARLRDDLEALLDRTHAEGDVLPAEPSSSIPGSFGGVAQELAAHREVLEAGGVFPPALIDRLIQAIGDMAESPVPQS